MDSAENLTSQKMMFSKPESSQFRPRVSSWVFIETAAEILPFYAQDTGLNRKRPLTAKLGMSLGRVIMQMITIKPSVNSSRPSESADG